MANQRWLEHVYTFRGDKMVEEKRTVTFTIVAFRYDKKNSIHYKNSADIDDIAHQVVKALRLMDADVISIRRVYEKCPAP